MPNGMYGGVRGERKSPLLDYGVDYAGRVQVRLLVHCWRESKIKGGRGGL